MTIPEAQAFPEINRMPTNDTRVASNSVFVDCKLVRRQRRDLAGLDYLAVFCPRWLYPRRFISHQNLFMMGLHGQPNVDGCYLTYPKHDSRQGELGETRRLHRQFVPAGREFGGHVEIKIVT